MLILSTDYVKSTVIYIFVILMNYFLNFQKVCSTPDQVLIERMFIKDEEESLKRDKAMIAEGKSKISDLCNVELLNMHLYSDGYIM